ncbi:uncharacterized protein (DUF952 family) [Nocardioides thalensis]|uniref:Uncharacterized protein (DUF952 family) n=1 Tax=Nocardioides thalensis TaxID=1914755 RepID=A0A853C5U0_9ACTN|nr:DUF952 domain-containing protein [Nocardioides thalensis]NYJ02042.1 uncharacterized protein (DUF952 family) [Nocardioides thalensis]
MATIFHLALASDWEAAQGEGAYTISTRGRTLAEEGFIHASRADQWPAVRERFYADVTEPLLLLQIDTDLLDVPVVEEPAAPGGTETFPHLYGPLRVDAVVRALPLPEAGTTPDGPAPTPAAPGPTAPGPSFSRLFLQEMFANVLVAAVVLVCTVAGAAVGYTQGDTGGLVGAGVGLAVGVVAGVWLHARRSGASAG